MTDLRVSFRMLEPAFSVHVWDKQDRALDGTVLAEQGKSDALQRQGPLLCLTMSLASALYHASVAS